MERKKRRTQRLIITASAEELKAIDDFRFANRMPSRVSAVREILRRGLIASAELPQEGMKSADSRVLGNNGVFQKRRKGSR